MTFFLPHLPPPHHLCSAVLLRWLGSVPHLHSVFYRCQSSDLQTAPWSLQLTGADQPQWSCSAAVGDAVVSLRVAVVIVVAADAAAPASDSDKNRDDK